MPKVSKEYIHQKKNQILDATLEILSVKPVFAVSMQDIIDQTGFSQGAIYRYFKDIDEIIIAVHNRSFEAIDYHDKLKDIFTSDFPPEEIIRQAFLCLSKHVNESLGLFHKMRFELLMLYQAYPNRGEKIQSALTVKQSNNAALEMALSFAMAQTENGYFKPIMPIEKILAFICASYDGILFDDMLFKNSTTNVPSKSDVTELFSTLCEVVILLLGGNQR